VISIRKRSTLAHPKLLAKAQEVFNRWVRERDKYRPCISCGVSGVDHAGHYFSQGHHSTLRFNEINVNGQCIRCNTFLHSNAIHYRNGLVKKYGEDKVLLLESSARNKAKKWSRTELEAIIEYYKL